MHAISPVNITTNSRRQVLRIKKKHHLRSSSQGSHYSRGFRHHPSITFPYSRLEVCLSPQSLTPTAEKSNSVFPHLFHKTAKETTR